jgi:primosomal protein N' (replication factor Y)
MLVGVHPLAGFDKLLHYRVPSAWEGVVAVGSLVRIPVGRRITVGIVAEVGPPSDYPVEKLKALVEAVFPFPALTPDLLGLARWMGAYYAAPLDAVMEAFLPAAVRAGAAIKQERMLIMGQRLEDEEVEALARRAPQQAKLYRFLATQSQPLRKSVVLRRLAVTAAVCAGLVRRGAIREEARRVERVAYADGFAEADHVATAPPDLNPQQREAVEALERSLAAGTFGVTLLHGVTGSGKTEVYLRAIEATLRAGGGVIFLVPEVALTPQTVARLRSRLESIAPEHRCVVWHSHLSEGERLDGWMALATGEARVVVGARSAVFAPVRGLRLIVVDEEHEPAYKQDESPRYHGRDVAVMRAKLCGAHGVLGSATPSLETWANARAGRYGLLRLAERVDGRRLPHIRVVDMKIEVMRQRGTATLSRPLVDAMQGRFERREQTILFINRRGYSSSLQCTKCGHTEECRHCSISMTYHRTDETLRCHLCGDARPAPVRCPSCAAPDIRWRGLGTQRVEEAVRRVLPRARIERIDADTMARKNRFRELLGEFRTGRIDVLVGTQMIGKGLDFPNVTLVGLVDADLSMHVPDFRANERTFQLLVQVAGRAGRGDRAGEVVVQTFTPQSETIQFSRHADFEGFAEAELHVRERFGYPPYRHLIHHLFRGPNEEKLAFYAQQWARTVEQAFGTRLEIKGPSPSPIEKIKDHYRWQLWYFVPSVTRVIAELNALRDRFAWPDDVVQVLDVDPASLI